MNIDEKSKNSESEGSNKGLNVRHFMIAVGIAIVVILAAALFFVGGQKTKVVPHANSPQPTTATPPQH